jgi:hypothetical protein
MNVYRFEYLYLFIYIFGADECIFIASFEEAWHFGEVAPLNGWGAHEIFVSPQAA